MAVITSLSRSWVSSMSPSGKGYLRRPGKYGGKPAVASPNLLKRQFDVVEPNKVWVTDITYIRT